MARPWMEAHGYSWSPPSDTVVLLEKFTDQYLPFDSLWTTFGQKLGITWSRSCSIPHEFRSAFADRHLVLIFDELERGITNIRSILPAKSEPEFSSNDFGGSQSHAALLWSRRSTTVVSNPALREGIRVGARFRKAEDRAAIVRHRLFSNADSYDRKAAKDLIQSYLNTWRRMGVRSTTIISLV